MTSTTLSLILSEAQKLDRDDLDTLIETLKELRFRQNSLDDTFDFEFQASCNKAYATPYVAQLSWEGEGFGRSFFDLERSYGGKDVFVQGSFSAKDGDIIELCRGGNTQRKFRSIYLVYLGGLEYLGKSDNAKVKHLIKSYLCREIQAHELKRLLF